MMHGRIALIEWRPDMLKLAVLRSAVSALRLDVGIRRAAVLVWRFAPWHCALAIALVALETGVFLGMFWLARRLMNVASQSSGSADPAALAWATVGIGAMAVAFVLARSVTAWVCGRLAQRVSEHCDLVLHERAASLSYPFYESPKYFDMLARARSSSGARIGGIVGAATTLLRGGLMLLAISIVLISIHWLWLPIAAVLAAPGLAMKLHFSRMQQSFERARTALHRKVGYFSELLSGAAAAKEVRANGLAESLLTEYARLRAEVMDSALVLNKKRAVYEAVGYSVATVALFACLAAVAWATVKGTRSMADFALFVIAFQQTFHAVNGLASGLGQLYDHGLHVQHFFELLDMGDPAVAAAGDRPIPSSEDLTIRFENVSFRYPGADCNAVTDIDCTFRTGQVVAIVGENGAGKSTLAKLLLRLYEPTAGRITLNGIDIREFSIDDYRRIFASVFQDALGFCLSARRNITLGDLTRPEDHEAVADAARRSGADEFLKVMPRGYDSVLGRLTDDGVELSGGQWQRLAIARAFYRNAAFLVLDEPTSALDPRAEGGLVGELRQVGRKSGVIVISHRLSTAKAADHVLVLDTGLLVEQGAPSDLLERSGAFVRLFEVQLGQHTEQAVA